MDEEQKEKLMATCSCESGKKYGECCGKDENCFCGSEMKASECCMKTPEAHEAM